MSSPYIYARAFPHRGALICGYAGLAWASTWSLVTPSMLWICLACCWTPATSFASSSVSSDQPHSHSTRFCIPHLLNSRPRRGKGGGFNPKTRVRNIIAGQLWRKFGGILLRIYLAGEVAVERGERLLREVDLAGRQGRLALGYLGAEPGRALAPAA